jgi:hypothetical protein
MTELVTIGCRYPNGYKLEVGIIVERQANGGAPMVMRGPSYATHTLKGTHWHQAAIFRMGILAPNQLNPQPFMNRIPKAFWEQWKKEHPDSRALKNGDIFEGRDDKNGNPDHASNKAIILDVMAKSPQPLAPVDKSKPIKIDDSIIETAKYDED